MIQFKGRFQEYECYFVTEIIGGTLHHLNTN